jgi:thiamine pyrophosphate-dependent acetolactate synthase large subunit-like protein
MQTGADAALRFVEERTAPRMFGLPGSTSVPLFHALNWSTAQFVPSRDEGSAVAMADGYARLRGPTAVSLYMVPGTATAMSNIYNAARDETSLVFLIAQQATRFRAHFGSVGEADIAPMLAPFTRSAREISHVDQLGEALDDAYRFAVGPPSGPVAVVIPEDLLKTSTATAELAPARTVAAVAPAEISMPVEALGTAQHPLIVAGGQVRRTGGTPALEALAEELQIPVMYEPFWNDRLAISPGHPCAAGQLIRDSSLAQTADVVIAVGCRMFNEVHPQQDSWFPHASLVAHVHADPAVVHAGRQSTWSAVGDPGAFLAQLLEQSRPRIDQSTVDQRRGRLAEVVADRCRPGSTRYSTVARALATELDHAWLVDESVSASAELLNALRSDRGDRYVSTSGGSLGWGIGAACGVALASGEPVTCVIGDGSFFFGLGALSPLVADGLPVTIVVVDNGGFGSTRYFEKRYARGLPDTDRRTAHRIGSDFSDAKPSICDLADGAGLETRDLPDAGDLAAHLDELRNKGPALVRVPVC